jgi:hypothetical protein
MSKYISIDHDYVLVFAKNISKLNRFYIPYDENYVKRYKEEDEKGKYFWDTFARNRQGSSNSYTIIAPDGEKLINSWIYKEDKFKKLLADDEIRFKKINTGWSVQVKQRINNQGQIMRSLIQDFTNEYGTKVINELLGKEIFSYVKPVGLIKHLIFTIENDCWGKKWGRRILEWAIKSEMFWKYVPYEKSNLKKKLIKEFVDKRHCIKMSADEDETTTYYEDNDIRCFSFCIPVELMDPDGIYGPWNEGMHSSKGLKVNKDDFEKYIRALYEIIWVTSEVK